MRHLIYLLLVANAVYYAWHLVESSTDDHARRVAAALPSGVKTIETIKEREDRRLQAELEDVAAVEALIESEPPAAGRMMGCQTIGPFLTQDTLAAAKKALRALSLDVEERNSQIREQIDYWVYLPAMEREAALQATRVLDQNKVKDYFIGKQNLISLGTFADKDRAEKHRETLRGLGLEPRVEPRFKARDVSWLDFVPAGSASEGLDDIIKRHQGIRLQALACK